MYLNGLEAELKSSAIGNNYVVGSSKERIGTAKNDIFHGVSGEALIGGIGDDSYNLWSGNVIVNEKAGQGVDTVFAQFAGKFTLPDQIENLVLKGAGMVAGEGNAISNIIIAGDVGAALDGRAGNDVLVGGKGSDLFKFSAGNGSDAVMNFISGQDAIKLEGYGISSFAQLLSRGKQVGDDVKFTFSNQEVLVLRDTKIGDLKGYDFGFEIERATLKPTDTLMDGADRAQNLNGWYVFNNSYGTSGLKQSDYSVSSTFNKADATAGTTFTWKMPYTTGDATKILAYPELIFGVPPMGAYAKNPGDKAAVFPVKVGDLVSLKADYDVSFSGNVSGFNVAYDIWLTSKPNGDRSTITNEIMVWVHKGDVPMAVKQVGAFSNGGVTYAIYNEGKYTAFVADRDVVQGELDITAMLSKLKTLGIVKDSEYLASIELGAEVISGVGSLTVNNLDIEVASRGANGNVVVKEVTGSGQTVHEVVPGKEQPTGDAQVPGGNPGVVSGKTVSTVENNVTTHKSYDANGRLTSIEKATAYASGDIKTEYMTASSIIIESQLQRRTSATTVNFERYSPTNKFLGADAVTTKPNGEVITARYDAAWQFSGADSVQTKANGDATTTHFDKAWRIIGSESVVAQANGDVITHFFNANYKLTGADVKSVDTSGVVSVYHFDEQWKITGVDKTVVQADGSVQTQHLSSKFALLSTDVERVGADGVETTTSLDGAGRLTSTEFIGTAADDVITGAAGTNVLHGGFGSDTLRANAGADVFVFDTAIGKDVDKIQGFSVGSDKLVLDIRVFSGLASGMLSIDAFQLGTTAADRSDRIVYDQKTGSIFFDADGNGGLAPVLFAKVDPRTALAAANFEVINQNSVIGSSMLDQVPTSVTSLLAQVFDLA
jgi:serralysin